MVSTRLIVLFSIFSFAFCQKPQTQLELEEQIIGGETVFIESYNYQVQILSNNASLLCGGSILSKTWILTAAHCVIERSINTLSIRAGSSYQGNGGFLHAVKNKITHPQYHIPRYNNDIAVVELMVPLTYGTAINFVRLATSVPPDRSTVTVTGWGRLYANGGGSAYQLQSVHLPMVNKDVCVRSYRRENVTITNNQICAGFMYKTGKDTCNGDSGGPLVYHGQQVGVVSFGKGCDNLFYPTVFANVVNLTSWIKQNAIVDDIRAKRKHRNHKKLY